MSGWRAVLWRRALLVGLLGMGLCVWTAVGREPAPRTDTVRVIQAYPHDPKAFSQGLVVVEGVLYESTGKYGESTLRQLDLASGAVKRVVELDPSIFGEGLAEFNGQFFQLTWKNKVVYLYDARTMEWRKTLRYAGEGWGLTHNGKELILSDGSATLRFLDPATLDVKRKITVRANNAPVDRLNELEFINGEVWANIWYQDQIARINPETGAVTAWVDCSTLWPANRKRDREEVLNGIAWDASGKKLYLTGKNWPALYEVEVVPRR